MSPIVPTKISSMVAPISMAELMNVVNELFVNPEAEPMGSSISFIGAKGGVGSSTIAHNVAFTISSSFSSDVVLADLDLPFGTANIDFDQDPAQGVAEAVFLVVAGGAGDRVVE